METVARLKPAAFSTLRARRICLVKPSALGDVVQSLPVLAALRARFPGAHLAWVVHRTLAPLLRPIPMLDETIEFDRDRFFRNGLAGIAEFRRFLRALRRRKFDLAVDLQGLFRSGLAAWATRAPRRIGLATAREGAGMFYTDVVRDDLGSPHAVDRYWRVAEALGVGHLPKTFPLGITAQERAAARRLLAGLPRPWLAVQPGTRWATKRWPPERFAATVNRAFAALGRGAGSAILLGAPGEEPLAQAVATSLNGPRIDLSGKTPLRELAAVLEACDAALTNDSGPMHMAAAVGTPTVAVFTCTSPERAGPHGAGHRIVQTSVACRGSYRRECPHLSCMAETTADRTLPALLAVLETTAPAAARAA